MSADDPNYYTTDNDNDRIILFTIIMEVNSVTIIK